MSLARHFAPLLNPGLRLMRRLRLPAKLMLLSAMLALPMLVVLVAVVHQALTENRRLHSNLDGAVVAQRLMV
ncbi:MAG: hypothetical protein RI907_1262, partial [Pseudomonadota bacterium]